MLGANSLVAEAQRQFDICNGCRYCEGYCAVFPAMEAKVWFSEGDVAYLANLCHDCRACYQACMYAPPHEFGVDIPTLLSTARVESYDRFSWPQAFLRLFSRGPVAVGYLTVAGSVLFGLVAWLSSAGPRFFSSGTEPGSFYRVIPFAAMLVPSLLLTGFILTAWVVGVLRFVSPGARVRDALDPAVWAAVARDVLTLRYQGAGGDDCYYPDAGRPSRARRVLHQSLVYGFALAFASTALAALFQDVLGRPPPYPLTHPVVLLGTAGGLGIVVGATGLLLLKHRSTALADRRETLMDYGFLGSLDLAGLSGLALLAFRATPAMGTLLVIHLGTLVALYLTAPYGKFVHAVYRLAALLRFEHDERSARKRNGE